MRGTSQQIAAMPRFDPKDHYAKMLKCYGLLEVGIGRSESSSSFSPFSQNFLQHYLPSSRRMHLQQSPRADRKARIESRRRGLPSCRRPMVEARRHLRDLSTQLSGLQRRRHRRPQRHHPAPRLPAIARRRCHLAHAHLSVAPGRLRLRHLRLREHRPAVRHPRRLRQARRRGQATPHPHHHGHGDEPHLRQAQMVHRVRQLKDQSQTRLVRLARRQRLRPPTESPSLPTTGSASSAAPPGSRTRRRSSSTTTSSTSSSPTSTGATPPSKRRCSTPSRFWLDRGVAGFRLDAIPTLFEDPAASQ